MGRWHTLPPHSPLVSFLLRFKALDVKFLACFITGMTRMQSEMYQMCLPTCQVRETEPFLHHCARGFASVSEDAYSTWVPGGEEKTWSPHGVVSSLTLNHLQASVWDADKPRETWCSISQEGSQGVNKCLHILNIVSNLNYLHWYLSAFQSKDESLIIAHLFTSKVRFLCFLLGTQPLTGEVALRRPDSCTRGRATVPGAPSHSTG